MVEPEMVPELVVQLAVKLTAPAPGLSAMVDSAPLEIK